MASPEELVRTVRHGGTGDERVIEAFRRVHREGSFPPDGGGGGLPLPLRSGFPPPGDHPARFRTAVLASVARDVFSVERFPDLAAWARRSLGAAGIARVTITVGDRSLGLPEHAPYDGIVVSAAAPEVPDPLVDQPAEGVRIVHPVGYGVDEIVAVYRKEKGALVREGTVAPAHFVRLVGQHGLPG